MFVRNIHVGKSRDMKFAQISILSDLQHILYNAFGPLIAINGKIRKHLINW